MQHENKFFSYFYNLKCIYYITKIRHSKDKTSFNMFNIFSYQLYILEFVKMIHVKDNTFRKLKHKTLKKMYCLYERKKGRVSNLNSRMLIKYYCEKSYKNLNASMIAIHIIFCDGISEPFLCALIRLYFANVIK